MQSKKVLIIGGTAGIAKDIIDLLATEFIIDATYNNENRMYDHEKVSWIKLDLNSTVSLNNFFNLIENNIYSIVIILSMTTPGDFFQNTEKELKEFYGNYLVNNMLLGKYLLDKILDDGKIVYISSIAGNKPVPSINYSTLKGALQSFYVSLSLNAKPRQSILCIVPGLIYESPAFYRHDPIMYNSDISMLTTKKELVECILASSPKDNGKMIRLGKDS